MCRSTLSKAAPLSFRSPPEQLILPGHLLDFTHKKNGEAITIVDFEETEEKSGQKIGPGTATICWIGTDGN